MDIPAMYLLMLWFASVHQTQSGKIKAKKNFIYYFESQVILFEWSITLEEKETIKSLDIIMGNVKFFTMNQNSTLELQNNYHKLFNCNIEANLVQKNNYLFEVQMKQSCSIENNEVYFCAVKFSSGDDVTDSIFSSKIYISNPNYVKKVAGVYSGALIFFIFVTCMAFLVRSKKKNDSTNLGMAAMKR